VVWLLFALSNNGRVTVANFRKRPIVIEAEQFTLDHKDRVYNWVGCNKYAHSDIDGNPVLVILTLEGAMTAALGDWIIKGVNGEYYPCKPDIFEKTYERIEEGKQ
jgi:hypothetical protein